MAQKGADLDQAAAERTERQREPEESQHQIQQRIQDREKELKLLQQQPEAINHSADQGESTPSSSINDRPRRSIEDVTAAVSQLKLQEEEREHISLTLTTVEVLPSEPEPESRADFFRYSRPITLDPNTAYRELSLSEENRKVTLMGEPQSYSKHPDRFINYNQVLSRESLTGRCYWEVECRGSCVYVAVSYKNISRSGGESRFGFNKKSWALRYSPYKFLFYHNSIETSISAAGSSRVGVYLDHRAGVLSFYSVSERMTLLHRVQTTFTQPLHAGLGVWGLLNVATANIC